MAKKVVIHRHVSNIQPGSQVEVTLAPGANGIFKADSRDLAGTNVVSNVPVPGTMVVVGSVIPPSIVLVLGTYSSVLTALNHFVDIGFRDANGKLVSVKRVPLVGAVGDSILIVVNLL